MSRDLKFRAWDKTAKQYYDVVDLGVGPHTWQRTAKNLLNQPFEPDTGKQKFYPTEVIVEQYTGLKDKHGKEIYENCELDGRYRVEYIAPKFVGKDMVKGDIIELYDNKFTITKEHCEISQNSERGIN